MSYFVTGATGFIGRNLVELLLRREGTMYALVREGSKGRLEELRRRWGVDEDRVVGIVGDVSEPRLGVSDSDVERLRGEVDHLFHLAAIYDMTADAESQRVANVGGTRHMVELAQAIGAGRVHMVSSIAAAGLYHGTWREDMFDEAENLDVHPYFRTKHDSEEVVRSECEQPWRVYRPGIVVGHSETGEMDKVDGPYYFFKLIRRIRNTVPQWMPMLGVEGREINIVPVDFVARAMDHIAHQDGLDGRAFHLTDPQPPSAGEVIDVFARAAHAPIVGAPSGRDPGCGAAVRAPGPLHRAARRRDRRSHPRRLRHPARGAYLRQLSHPLRLPPGAGGPRGHRHQGAAARGLRRQAVGLLGAASGPRPVR
jgi:thioester reductase-like protein